MTTTTCVIWYYRNHHSRRPKNRQILWLNKLKRIECCGWCSFLCRIKLKCKKNKTSNSTITSWREKNYNWGRRWKGNDEVRLLLKLKIDQLLQSAIRVCSKHIRKKCGIAFHSSRSVLLFHILIIWLDFMTLVQIGKIDTALLLYRDISFLL